jgi:hypothetical protein
MDGAAGGSCHFLHKQLQEHLAKQTNIWFMRRCGYRRFQKI